MGATAGGKTQVAVELAKRLGTEIISADSRQVYRGMDIGTGKDIDDYVVDGQKIPYHLIDICDAGEKYNVFEFQHDFFVAYDDIRKRGMIPVLCGGTGFYIESVLKLYNLPNVPENKELRKSLEDKSIEELEQILRTYKTLNNNSDYDTKKRAIRAIEIAEYTQNHPLDTITKREVNSLNIGILFERDQRRERITQRLKARLENGMIEEVERLVAQGVSYENLEYYGLEYKYVAWYLQGKINYEELFSQLNSAIHQFSKRQMTWFRKMERGGIKINWIDGNLCNDEKVEQILALLK
ncbi:MAG: tRNA (adenosine(37)-N6)-dimethylallyltransferase MiaA [Bacteroidales bacterium]|nr:tRNA (adenosine(37)-N6)-dimethylallyltransferase MiaA [Bacteroidales bacterium]